jgi:hypothetical protein
MKVLFAFPENDNPYTYELAEMIKVYGNAETHIGVDHFWGRKLEADIVHIHWPDALIPLWKKPTHQDLLALEEALEYWSLRSVIVVTRHNLLPHQSNEKVYEDLYSMVYSYADAIIHMGKFSMEEFTQRYKNLQTKGLSRQSIIPHPMYKAFPNSISKEEARKTLGISKNRFVILAFGDIRTQSEVKLLKESFDRLHLRKKLLLVPRWKYSDNKIYKRLQFYYYQLHPDFYFGANHLGKKIVKVEDVQLYFNAADITIIPRINSLNSGVLILGFQFGQVVVGPDFGVIGEILKETGNPTFNHEEPGSVVSSMKAAESLAKAGKGNENRKYAEANWNHERVSMGHVNLYRELLKEKKIK